MKSKIFLLPFFIFSLITIHAQEIVVKYSNEYLKNENSFEGSFHKAYLGYFNQHQRILVHNESLGKTPMYTLDVVPTFNRIIEIGNPIFLDSTLSITVPRLSAKAILYTATTIQNIATSEIVLTHKIDQSFDLQNSVTGHVNQETFTYKDFDITPTSLRNMSSNDRQTLIRGVRLKARNQANKTVQVWANRKFNNLVYQSVLAVRTHFPYQLKANFKNTGKGKIVELDGGKNYDLQEGSSIIFYEKKSITHQNKTFFHLAPYSTGIVKSIDNNTCTVKIKKKKKKLRKAIEAGLELYANEGTLPLQLI